MSKYTELELKTSTTKERLMSEAKERLMSEANVWFCLAFLAIFCKLLLIFF